MYVSCSDIEIDVENEIVEVANKLVNSPSSIQCFRRRSEFLPSVVTWNAGMSLREHLSGCGFERVRCTCGPSVGLGTASCAGKGVRNDNFHRCRTFSPQALWLTEGFTLDDALPLGGVFY